MSKPKAIGSRGSWFAEVLGELLPCVSDRHLSRRHYVDAGSDPSKSKWDRYIEAIKRSKRVVLTHSKSRPDVGSRETVMWQYSRSRTSS